MSGKEIRAVRIPPVIVGIGTDLFEVARMARELRDGGEAFREHVFTPAESDYCVSKRYPPRHFAARFAAKEALFKALGGGAAPAFRDVEVKVDGEGRPSLLLHGRTHEAAERLGVRGVHVSLSHTRGLAAAHVVLER